MKARRSIHRSRSRLPVWAFPGAVVRRVAAQIPMVAVAAVVTASMSTGCAAQRPRPALAADTPSQATAVHVAEAKAMIDLASFLETRPGPVAEREAARLYDAALAALSRANRQSQD